MNSIGSKARKLRICLVSDRLPEFHKKWSGAEQLCFRFSQMLRESGHDVVLLTTKIEKDNDKKNHNKDIYEVPTCLDKSRYSKIVFPFDIASLFYSIMLLRKLRPDIVHLHAQGLFLPVLISAIVLKIPVVMTVLDYAIICPLASLRKPDGQLCTRYHGSHCSECADSAKNPLMTVIQTATNFRRAVIYDSLVRHLDSIITLSKTSKRRLEQYYGLTSDRIRVIYHYQLEHKEEGAKPSGLPFERPTVLFVGWVNELRGLHIIIEAMPRIVKQIPKSQLLVVGSEEDNQYVARIRSMIEAKKLGRHVGLLGKKRNKEVLHFISRSGVIVVPLQWPNEFGPLILVEAMSLGKPVVASRIGATPEFIEDGFNGFLVAHNEPKQFAEKVIWLLKNKKFAQLMGENAKKSLRLLYNKDPTQEIVDLYYSIVRTKDRNKLVRY